MFICYSQGKELVLFQCSKCIAKTYNCKYLNVYSIHFVEKYFEYFIPNTFEKCFNQTQKILLKCELS